MVRSHPHLWAWLALIAVCFFWGTTYLGIRMALETFQPATLVSLRYLISGAVMLAGCLALRVHIPSGRELALSALSGVIVLGVGNGCLAFAEEWIPSGLAAMFVTTGPFWMVGMDALLPGGERLHGPTVLGMLVGLAGTLLLVAPSGGGVSGPVLKAFLLLQIGCCGWALGSALLRRQQTKAHPIVSGAVQQLATGIAFLVPAVAMQHGPVRWNPRGLSALMYLVVFGSIVGYSAYVYALQHLPVSIVSLYNYINPIVAVVLGYLIYGEQFGLREIVGMAIIFAGVALVKRFSVRSKPPAVPLASASAR